VDGAKVALVMAGWLALALIQWNIHFNIKIRITF
jgi:hypothetical protein